jgi:TonB-dependent starch-binding outer membrane protein SusC
MKSKLLLVILFSLVCSYVLNAQKNDKTLITGTVVDLDEAPVPDAMIIVDDKRTNTLTDSAGHYSIQVSISASKIGVMAFSNGYYEEEIANRKVVDINFSNVSKVSVYSRREDDPDSDEAELRGRSNAGEVGINLGYAYVKRKYVAADIDFIDGTDKKFKGYSSVIEMIIRNVSGVHQIGGKIVIWGSSNLMGYVEPMIMIDGTYAETNDLYSVSPSSVRSIAVMKSAAASIYGSRGYGGAILVTTRLGL